MSRLLERIETTTASGNTARATDRCVDGVLSSGATASGLIVRASASWPDSAQDHDVPPLAGFVVSTFNPLVAEVSERCLRRRPDAGETPHHVTAVILVSALGDVTSAARVADVVDAGERVKPLMFFQSVPNAVAGYVAARWRLTGPVVCVGTVGAGMSVAALLIADGDADDALIVLIEQASADMPSDRAEAVLVEAGSEATEHAYAHDADTEDSPGPDPHRSKGVQP